MRISFVPVHVLKEKMDKLWLGLVRGFVQILMMQSFWGEAHFLILSVIRQLSVQRIDYDESSFLHSLAYSKPSSVEKNFFSSSVSGIRRMDGSLLITEQPPLLGVRET